MILMNVYMLPFCFHEIWEGHLLTLSPVTETRAQRDEKTCSMTETVQNPFSITLPIPHHVPILLSYHAQYILSFKEGIQWMCSSLSRLGWGKQGWHIMSQQYSQISGSSMRPFDPEFTNSSLCWLNKSSEATKAIEYQDAEHSFSVYII